MPQVDFQSGNSAPVPDPRHSTTPERVNFVPAVALLLLISGAPLACAASLSRSVDVAGTPSAVWSVIGPFCAIESWLPPVGTCTEDGNVPPTRTLVTKDGKAIFVELQIARSDTMHFYTYTFRSSPLPVTHYESTIEVAAKGRGVSTVTWRSTYTPDDGKEKEASEALAAIYGSGLDAIRSRFAK